jgi:hypothetical protein
VIDRFVVQPGPFHREAGISGVHIKTYNIVENLEIYFFTIHETGIRDTAKISTCAQPYSGKDQQTQKQSFFHPEAFIWRKIRVFIHRRPSQVNFKRIFTGQ